VSESALPLTLFDWGRRHSCIWGVLLQADSTIKTDPLFQRLTGRIFTFVASLQPSTSVAEIDAERDQLRTKTGLSDDLGPLPGKDAIDGSYRWRLTLSLLNLLNTKCTEEGSKFMVASMPGFENRSQFKSQFRVIEGLGKASKFTAFDLTPSFETAPNQTVDSLYLAGHLSPRGHNLVAEQLSQAILKSTK